jgi:hypothetical protein
LTRRLIDWLNLLLLIDLLILLNSVNIPKRLDYLSLQLNLKDKKELQEEFLRAPLRKNLKLLISYFKILVKRYIFQLITVTKWKQI